MTGSAFQSATYIPNVTLGLLNSNGKGNASASYDEFRSRSRAQQTYTGRTYAMDATTGRTPIECFGVTNGIQNHLRGTLTAPILPLAPGCSKPDRLALLQRLA
jgi:hypothetical protein